jgi:hypothetical protein
LRFPLFVDVKSARKNAEISSVPPYVDPVADGQNILAVAGYLGADAFAVFKHTGYIDDVADKGNRNCPGRAFDEDD